MGRPDRYNGSFGMEIGAKGDQTGLAIQDTTLTKERQKSNGYCSVPERLLPDFPCNFENTYPMHTHFSHFTAAQSVRTQLSDSSDGTTLGE
ncbi:unnamed protein product [Litomosoides sigmodontis]|uniref:Uncharacterized protein n=1 Tax=Litomosoides sigmodontis TaxID=42156 RepID=A0A3P7M189_LITSI|nr:unnamed protein product [Litomosoides sigmodontis]